MLSTRQLRKRQTHITLLSSHWTEVLVSKVATCDAGQSTLRSRTGSSNRQPMYRSKCCSVSYDVGTNSLPWYQVGHVNRVPLIVSSCAWNSPSTQQNNSIQIPQIQPAGTISKAKKVHVKRHNTLLSLSVTSYALYPSIRFCTLFDIKLVQRTHTIRSTLIKCWYERKHQEHRK